jgi:hypothetical protein
VAGKTAEQPFANLLGLIAKQDQPDAPGEVVSYGKFSKREQKEKEPNQSKSPSNATDNPALVLSAIPGQQTINPPLPLLSWRKQQAFTKSAPDASPSSAVPNAPNAPVQNGTRSDNDPAYVVHKPLAFSVNIAKTPSVDTPPSVAAESASTFAPVQKNVSHSDKNPNGRQQHSDSAESDQSKAVVKSTASEAVLKPNVPAPLTSVIAAPASASGNMQQIPASYAASKPVQLTETTKTSEATAIPDLPSTVTPRSRSIDLKVAGDDNNQVDVRVSQRAGDVQVTVRTEDGNLAQSLRQHLPELSDRLSANGVTGEVWHPAAAQASTDTSSSSDSWSAGDPDSQSGQRDSNSQPNQGQQQNGRRSAWAQELNTAEKEGR